MKYKGTLYLFSFEKTWKIMLKAFANDLACDSFLLNSGKQDHKQT